MDESTLLYLLLIFLTGLIGILIGIVIMLIKDSGKDRNQQAITEQQIPVYTSETAYGRVWRIELRDLNSNMYFRKDFCGQLILGRRTTGEELFWMMWIGSDASISRQHCVIFDRGGYLVIENLSQTNITLVNGQRLELPCYLQQGNVITIGRSSYCVDLLQRIA